MGRNTERVFEEMLAMHEAGQATIANQEKLQQEGAQFVASTDGEASFAMPEALATAAGAAWLMGPAGILLGIAQGILGKKEQQSAIDRYRAEQESLNSINDVIGDKLDDLYNNAASDADRNIVDALRTKLHAAQKLTAKANPQLMPIAAQMATSLQDEIIQFETTNEAQQIAAEVKEDELKRQLGETQYNRFTDLMSKYDAQSQGFENGRLAANKARAALKRGDPVGLVAATRLAIRTVEPTGPLTDEDVKAFASIGNVRDRLEAMAEEWIGTGAQLTDPQRIQFETMINMFDRENNALQMSKDVRYQNLAEIAELPQDKVEMFNRVSELPVNMGGEFIPNKDKDRLIDPSAVSDQALFSKGAEIAGKVAEIPSLIQPDTRTLEQQRADMDRYGRLGRD